MKSTSFTPLLVFILVFILLAYRALFPIDTNIRITHPKNLKVEFSQLKSMHTSSALLHPKQKYILNIFSSWCSHCQAAHNELLNLTKEKNIKIIGIVWNDSKDNIEKMLKDYGNPYFGIASVDDNFIVNLGVTAIPETFIVDTDDSVLLKITGPISKGALDDAVYPLLK